MKSYRELMGETVVLDLPKARKNKIFKREGEEKKIEHLISRLLLSNYIDMVWTITSEGYEMAINDKYKKKSYYKGDDILQTLERAMKELRIKA